MNYWLDLFTVTTFEEFQKAGAKVTGFRERQWKRCQRVQAGDKLLCYLTGISRWVGVLTVTGPAYSSEERIWEMEVFPVRLPVEAEILLMPEHGVPHQSLMPTLHSPAKAWAGYLRGSPNLLKPEDGKMIAEALSKAKDSPVLRPFDKKKASPTPPASRAGEPASGERDDAKPGLCPWLPTFSQIRGYLSAVDGVPVAALEKLHTAVAELCGTPQDPVSWDDPEQWISERLTGDVQNLARAVWTKSGDSVNPRYLRGPAIVADRYDLAEESTDGRWAVTPAGRDLLAARFGPTEKGIDLQEGMAQIMRIAQAKPDSRRSDLVGDWRDFVATHAGTYKDSSVKHFLHNRLQNLMDRGLVGRDGQRYRLTQAGADYSAALSSALPAPAEAQGQRLIRAAEEFNRSQRDLLRERLENMNPYAFEHLIRDLLTEMGYEGVEVTQPANDKGVDVKAVAQFGITSINEVIQVKRHRANVQRTVLDMLRGSLHRFKAQKGTIITTGDFGKGAKEAAFEMGAAPITLINGDTLIDLLFEHGVGVKRKTVNYFEVDEELFLAVTDELTGVGNGAEPEIDED